LGGERDFFIEIKNDKNNNTLSLHHNKENENTQKVLHIRLDKNNPAPSIKGQVATSWQTIN
jgi:hypothetical protein